MNTRVYSRTLVAFVGLMLCSVSAAQAQTCVGLPSLAKAQRTLSTTGAGTDLGRTLVARYGVAGEHVFGGLQLGVAGQKFARLTTPVYGGDVGLVVPLGRSGATQLCPVLQTVYQHGPNGSNYTSNRRAISLALSAGHAISVGTSSAVVPFVQGGVQHLRQGYGYTGVSLYANEPGQGIWGVSNRVFGEVAVGLGLRLGDRLTISPSYRIPVGLPTEPRDFASSNNHSGNAGIYQQTYSVAITLGLPR